MTTTNNTKIQVGGTYRLKAGHTAAGSFGARVRVVSTVWNGAPLITFQRWIESKGQFTKAGTSVSPKAFRDMYESTEGN